MALKVTFDDAVFVGQVRGGISRYFTELAKAMMERQDPTPVEVQYAFERTNNAHLVELELGNRFRRERPLPDRYWPWLNSKVKADGLVRRYRSSQRVLDGDVLHYTLYQRLPRLEARHRITTVTIHDMIPEILDWRGQSPHAGKMELAAAADLIFCVSEATRHDLELYAPGLGRKSIVVPHGVSDRFFRINGGLGRPETTPLVLHVGSRNGYKNFGRLVSAMKQIRDTIPGIKLVAAGPPLSAQEKSEWRHAVEEKWLVFRNPTDTELISLYQAAAVVVMPSLYEGFGLPILEALASRAPVVCSDISAHREVGKDFVHFFDPTLSSSIADAVLYALSNPHKWNLDDGQRHAATYTWKRAADITLRAYLARLA